MGLRSIFFDLDDTLCDDSGSWHQCAAATAALAVQRVPNLDADAVARYFLTHSDSYWRTLDPTRETRAILEIRTDHWAVTLAAFGQADRAFAEDLAQDYGYRRSTQIALFPDALPLLSALRSAGKTLVLITNGLQSTHLERIAFLGLESYFDHTLISDALGLSKPDPRIFQRALELSGCKPHEAAMVGDSLLNDVAGAQAVGIPAYWFNPYGRLFPPGIPAPIGGEVRSLKDLRLLFLPS